MKRSFVTLSLCALAVGPALAETDSLGVTTSTDPAKVAAVERHAAELRAREANRTIERAPTGAGATHTTKQRHHRHHRHHTATKAAATKAKP